MTQPVRVMESARSRAIRRFNEHIAGAVQCVALVCIFLCPFVGVAFLSANGAGLLMVLVLLPAVGLLLAGWWIFHLQARVVLTGALLLQPLLCLLALLAFGVVMLGAAPASALPVNPFASGAARAVLLLGCVCSFAVLFALSSVISRIPKNVKLFLSVSMLLVTLAYQAAACLHVAGH